MKNWLRYTLSPRCSWPAWPCPSWPTNAGDDPADPLRPRPTCMMTAAPSTIPRGPGRQRQRWVYDYNTDGTAEHVVLLPRASTTRYRLGHPVDVDLDGDGVVDGTYYVKQQHSAMAVVASSSPRPGDDTLYYLVGMVQRATCRVGQRAQTPRGRRRDESAGDGAGGGTWQ
jgi:hypothetical protein